MSTKQQKTAVDSTIEKRRTDELVEHSSPSPNDGAAAETV
jgi:hypothetical protein